MSYELIPFFLAMVIARICTESSVRDKKLEEFRNKLLLARNYEQNQFILQLLK